MPFRWIGQSPQPRGGGDAVHARHAHIDQGHVDTVRGGLLDALEAVGGLGDDLDPLSTIEEVGGERLRTGRVGRGIPGPVWQRAEVPYRRIAPYSVAAACSWATIEAVVGYSAARPLQRLLTLGWPALAALGLLAVVGCASLWMRKN